MVPVTVLTTQVSSSYSNKDQCRARTLLVDTASTNFVKRLAESNINDTDVWLYQLDQFGQIKEEWTQVPSLAGNNAIYNSLSNQIFETFTTL